MAEGNNAGAVAVSTVSILAVGILLCAGISFASIGVGWSSFVQFGILTDMADLEIAIRDSNVDDPARAELLSKLREIREDFETGEIEMGFFQWVSHDDLLDSLVEDGRINPEEAATLAAELDLVARSGASP